MAGTTLDISTRDPTSVKAMEMVIPMAIDTMVETMETTPTIIIMETMEIIMEEMDNTTPNQWLRRISRQSLVICANKRDTMRISVQKMVLQDFSELDDRRMPRSTRRRHNKV
jgi:hypothetical protein